MVKFTYVCIICIIIDLLIIYKIFSLPNNIIKIGNKLPYLIVKANVKRFPQAQIVCNNLLLKCSKNMIK